MLYNCDPGKASRLADYRMYCNPYHLMVVNDHELQVLHFVEDTPTMGLRRQKLISQPIQQVLSMVNSNNHNMTFTPSLP